MYLVNTGKMYLVNTCNVYFVHTWKVYLVNTCKIYLVNTCKIYLVNTWKVYLVNIKKNKRPEGRVPIRAREGAGGRGGVGFPVDPAGPNICSGSNRQ